MAANSAQFPQANDKYVASFGDKGSLALPPARQLIVGQISHMPQRHRPRETHEDAALVTCMDARLDPAAHLGLKEGDAHVIRNAGGAVADALRSIVISQRLLGTREIAIFKHTGCGMLTFTTQQLRDKVVAEQPGDAEVASQVSQIHFHEFPELEGAVKSDVAWLKANPLVLKETTISGWIYEVETGKIRQVV